MITIIEKAGDLGGLFVARRLDGDQEAVLADSCVGTYDAFYNQNEGPFVPQFAETLTVDDVKLILDGFMMALEELITFDDLE